LVRGNYQSDDGMAFTFLRRRRRSHLHQMNGAAFVVISVFTLSTALAAASLPNLMHAALCFVLTLLGLASFFFLLGAEFVGLVLVFIYVGAVAVLIVFTILLTRRGSRERRGFNWSGVLTALGVFGCLTWAILKTRSLTIVPPHIRGVTVKQIGQVLMTGYVWPLQCVGVLLTAALIGALVLVMEEKR
jgi:NADH-quinone oxidoreductase subunit J